MFPLPSYIISPVRDPWLFLGWGCTSSGWRERLLCLRSPEALSLGSELDLTRSHGESEEGCPQESWAPELQRDENMIQTCTQNMKYFFRMLEMFCSWIKVFYLSSRIACYVRMY